MFQEKVVISSNDIDARLNIRLANLMRIVQDVITDHTEEINIGRKETIDKGIIWVVTRLRMDINRLPKYQEEVIVKTYPGENKSFFYPRYIIIEDLKGNELVKLSSIWTLLDAKTRMVTISKDIASRVVPESHEGELPLPDRVDIKEELNEKEIRKVHYHEVDLNGHLNFTKYIEFVLDLHDNEFYDNHPISSITLNYSKEIKENQMVKICSNDSNPEEVKIISDKGDHLFAIIKY